MYFDDSHPSVAVPPLETKVWRYIDLAKLVSLLDSEQLFFSRLDKLGDPLEGTYTKKNYEVLESQIDDSNNNYIKQIEDVVRKSFYVNCWHINEVESAGMWSVYAALDKGIAIQSTVGRIQESLSEEQRDVRMSRIKYLDRRIDAVAGNNLFYPALTKGSYYSYENELRLFYWIIGQPSSGEPNPYTSSGVDDRNFPEMGIQIKTNLGVLVENIYISPFAPEWFLNIIKSLLQAYKLEVLVERLKFSDMREERFF